MADGRTMWLALDAAWFDRDGPDELGDEFGPAGPLTLIAMMCQAKLQNEEGRMVGAWRTLAKRNHTQDVDLTRRIVEHANEIGVLDDLDTTDGRRFSCRLSGWSADQDAGNSAWRGDSGKASDEAARWLTDALVDGPVASSDLKAMAADDGLAWRTVQRVARQVGACLAREGKKTTWSLPQAHVTQNPRQDGGASGASGARPEPLGTDPETWHGNSLSRHAPPAQHSKGKEEEGERASTLGESSGQDLGPAAAFIPPAADVELPTFWADLIAALSAVPEWRTALTLGGDVAVLQLVASTSGVPWVDLAKEAVSSKFDTAPNSLRTGSPAHALTLRRQSWELRQKAEARRRRGKAQETDDQIAERHARQEAALRRLSGGSLFSPTDEEGAAA